MIDVARNAEIDQDEPSLRMSALQRGDVRAMEYDVWRAGGGDHYVGARKRVPQLAPVQGLGAHSVGELMRCSGRATDHTNISRSLLIQGARCQAGRFSGAEKDDAQLAEVGAFPADQQRRRRAHRERLRSDTCLGASALPLMAAQGT